MRRIDLTGKRFGKLVALRIGVPAAFGDTTHSTWNCICDCGRESTVETQKLRSGHTKSCGCLKPAEVDQVGFRYGRITVLSETRRAGRKAWLCQCDCGDKGVILSANLGRSFISCRCHLERIGAQHRIHGHSSGRQSRTYLAWRNAKLRCYDQKNKRYDRYGGRGIAMCDRWRNSFEAFLEDMGECPTDMTIERNDVDGDYEPDNCRWATKLDQARNKTTSLKARATDGTSKTIKQIAEERGLNYYTLRMAAKRGEDPATFVPRSQTDRDRQRS